MEALRLLSRREVEGGTVIRTRKAYPIYDHGYAARLELLRDYLAGFANLEPIGRNGLHRYNNQDHSMLSALHAARNVLAGRRLHDVWSVNTDPAYHESHERRQPLPAE